MQTVQKITECFECNGDGVVDYNYEGEDCPICDGRGWVRGNK